MTIRIILADDHEVVRDGLCSLIERETDMEVIAQAINGRQTVELAKELHPDVIVMDIAMPDLNGIEATRQIVAEHPEIMIVALSMHSDRGFVAEMLKAGAAGYVPKDRPGKEVIAAVRTVIKKGVYLPPSLASLVVDGFVRHRPDAKAGVFAVLTAREREVLQLLAEGKSIKQVAALLHVSVSTIETHRRNIMEKLEIYSVAELTKYAIREGLTSLDS
jgi:two-component system response regulator NreC